MRKIAFVVLVVVAVVPAGFRLKAEATEPAFRLKAEATESAFRLKAAGAQATGEEKLDYAAIAQIRDEGLNRSQAMETLF